MRTIDIVGGVLVAVAFVLALVYRQEALEVFYAFIDWLRSVW
jgi:hypothetical protein